MKKDLAYYFYGRWLQASSLIEKISKANSELFNAIANSTFSGVQRSKEFDIKTEGNRLLLPRR